MGSQSDVYILERNTSEVIEDAVVGVFSSLGEALDFATDNLHLLDDNKSWFKTYREIINCPDSGRYFYFMDRLGNIGEGDQPAGPLYIIKQDQCWK